MARRNDPVPTIQLLDREEMLAVVQSIPYSISERGPTDIAGVGNYIVQLYSSYAAAPAHHAKAHGGARRLTAALVRARTRPGIARDGGVCAANQHHQRRQPVLL